MSLIDRLQAAYYSPLGTLLLLLLLVFGFELILYAFLQRKKKREDLLAATYSRHFELAATFLKGLEQIGASQADLWGRQAVVKLGQERYGKSIIVLPELTEEDATARFSALSHAWKDQIDTPFTQLVKSTIQPIWGLVVQGDIRENGRPYLALSRQIADQRLSDHDKQKFLIQIATALGRLHRVQLGNGERLYHGALLPRSIAVDLDASSVMKQFRIADTGIVYALGAQRFYNLIQQLKRRNLPMDRFLMQEWMKWLPFLAPEQIELTRLHQVGQAADFFSFGALAVWLFTEQLQFNPEFVVWSKLPINWQPFLEKCLHNDPTKRPNDFHELEDWNSDPELSLLAEQTTQLKQEHESSLNLTSADEQSIEELMHLLNISSDNSAIKNSRKEVINWLEKGAQAQLKGEWKNSIPFYTKALKRLPNHPEICVKLAIAYYEISEWQKAEDYYALAKEKDAGIARAFREHLAFRL